MIRWTVDECPDAQGNFTLRASDGGPNGDTVSQPIATFYEGENADLAAAAPQMLDVLRECLAPMIRLGDFIGNEDKPGKAGIGPFDRCAIIGRVRDALAKAEGRTP